jgi:hypothetical protein
MSEPVVQRWTFRWEAAGYGLSKAEALKDAQAWVDLSEPCKCKNTTEEDERVNGRAH